MSSIAKGEISQNYSGKAKYAAEPRTEVQPLAALQPPTDRRRKKPFFRWVPVLVRGSAPAYLSA
jgi:hypothetical protein